MIAITFAMELTVLCVSLYWQSSLVLACGHFLFPRVMAGAGIELSRQSGRGKAGSGMLRLPGSADLPGAMGAAGERREGCGTHLWAPRKAILTPSSSTHQKCWGELAVGARRTCLRGFWIRAGLATCVGDWLMLSRLLLHGIFSWTSPRTRDGRAALLSCQLPLLPQSLLGHVHCGKDL